MAQSHAASRVPQSLEVCVWAGDWGVLTSRDVFAKLRASVARGASVEGLASSPISWLVRIGQGGWHLAPGTAMPGLGQEDASTDGVALVGSVRARFGVAGRAPDWRVPERALDSNCPRCSPSRVAARAPADQAGLDFKFQPVPAPWADAPAPSTPGPGGALLLLSCGHCGCLTRLCGAHRGHHPGRSSSSSPRPIPVEARACSLLS